MSQLYYVNVAVLTLIFGKVLFVFLFVADCVMFLQAGRVQVSLVAPKS